MQFNPGSNGGIVDEINDICNSDNNSYPLTSKARRVNEGLDRFFTLAFQADGRWTYDDTNQTTAPLQSINLVANTQAYAIDTFTSEILNILRAEMKDANGLSHVLKRLDESTLETSLTEYQSTAGTPTEYRLFGKYIYLYPKPSYNSTNGLSLYFERNKVAFTSASTTTSPGIPSLFHKYLCNYAALPYLIEMQKAQKNDIAALIANDEEKISDYFFSREKGVRKHISPSQESNK